MALLTYQHVSVQEIGKRRVGRNLRPIQRPRQFSWKGS